MRAQFPRRGKIFCSRWKGQIGLEAEDVSWYIFILHYMGQEKSKTFLQQLSRQQPQVRSGHNLIAQLLTGGEFGSAPTARVHRVEEAKREGAPGDWLAIEPLAPEPPICISLPKNGPRPNAGKLFIDFVLSAEAQEMIYQLKRSPSQVDTPQPVPRLAQIKLLEIEYDQEAKDFARYGREYRGHFRATLIGKLGSVACGIFGRREFLMIEVIIFR